MNSTTLTTRDTSRAKLWAGAQAGRYERIARGIYRPAEADEADWDMIEAAARRPDATICLISALAHHGLTDEIPSALDMAIPRGSRIPATQNAIEWHLFDKATFELGREEMTIPGTDGQKIGIYSPERCIADAFRLRAELGYEIPTQALRTWLARGGKPGALAELAGKLPRAGKPLLEAIAILA